MECPRKKLRSQPKTQKTCIKCSKLEAESELTKLRNQKSLNVLLDAATIQSFSPILALSEHQCNERLLYNRHCQSSFTNKKTLEKFCQSSESKCSSVVRRSSRVPSKSFHVFKEAICIFCEKKNEYLPGSNKREILQQCRTICADEKVRQAALDKLTIVYLFLQAVIWSLVRLTITSCYRNYTRDVKQKPVNNNKMECDEATYKAAEHEAYKKLFSDFR